MILKLTTFRKKKIVGNKHILTNIYRMHVHYLIMCGYFCTGFIGFMLNNKRPTDYTNFLSPNNFKNNNKIILEYFRKLKTRIYLQLRSESRSESHF